jgi:hypothetical protein
LARFYSNENFPRPIVVALRGLGHDVLTSLKAGQANRKIPDEEVVVFATNVGRAVLTLNRRHFTREHRLSAKHAGIVTCTVDVDYGALAKRVHHAVVGLSDLSGKLIRVTRGT